jgi:hypothetical protein
MRIWEHGDYVDMWSLVHLLVGILATGILLNLFSAIWAFAALVFGAVAWELFEAALGIGEHMANYVTDIALAIVGYFFAAYFYFILNKSFSVSALGALALACALLSLWGFWDMRKNRRTG